MFATLLPITGPVMVCVLLGFVWKRLNWAYDTRMVTQLVMRVGAPCLVVSSLSRTPVSQDLLEQMLLVTLAMVAATAALAVVAVLLARQPLRTYLGPLLFPNAGNMGLPICLFAFGDAGLTLALAIFMVLSVLHFTLGIALVSGRSVFREMISNPIIYSIVLAVIMIYARIELPLWLGNTVQLLSEFTIPLMLLTLGVSLADMKLQAVGSSLYFSLARLLIGVGVGWGVAYLFNLQGVAKGVLILQSAMPVAVFNYLFAMQYNRDPQVVAGMVIISTLLSFALIPVLLVFLL
ncbi:MAG: AEC family transporter [Gammaproteobacteria bacterium]|nr:AEC family transporter [Gammaproteobacteria bacterium]